jgi:ABC-type multidrug transport system ATPase subunit
MELKITNLQKQYRRGTMALRGVDLTLHNGMFGLLGPNGAGKTTLMKILVTLLEPTAGRVSFDNLVLGQDDQAIRARLGYLPQQYGLYPNLTAREVLQYMAHLHGRFLTNSEADTHLAQVNLLAAAQQRVGGFSGGMRQRLGIAQALLNNPALLIVDEPTAGLDPEERIRFRNLLARISGDRVVILSTHIVNDINSSCDDMALLVGGQLHFRGRPADLIEQVRGFVWQVTAVPTDVPAIETDYQVISAVRRSEGVQLRLLAQPETITNLANVTPEPPTLEDAYIWVMRQSAAVQS